MLVSRTLMPACRIVSLSTDVTLLFSNFSSFIRFLQGFSTGSPDKANDEIDDLSDEAVCGIVGWAMFYRSHENYTYVGKVIGRYYDSEGKPTKEWHDAIRRYKLVKEKEKRLEEDKIVGLNSLLKCVYQYRHNRIAFLMDIFEQKLNICM